MASSKENHGPKIRLEKAATGVAGLDEITAGGLPRGRPTLISGTPGCGKTLLAMQFIVNGATLYKEPGVFMSFEETAEELSLNMASLGVDLKKLESEKKLLIDYVKVDRNEIEHSGSYDLEGLFVRLGNAIDAIGARRVALDTIEILFSGLPDPLTLRSEIGRLFRFLKDRKVTTVATAERELDSLTRHGLEEFVSDCVISLDHRVDQNISTRHLRVMKYRGSLHGTNDYPFLIDENGISVAPITSIGLNHKASLERVSTGIPRLDEMLENKGYYRGASVLVSGTAGSGKSSLAAHFINAACGRGERALYFAFEESPAQIMRNMRSIGIDLAPWTKNGLLQFEAARPSNFGLEMHLARIYNTVKRFRPDVVVLDPVSNLLTAGLMSEVSSMLRRLVDFLKSANITAIFTNLATGQAELEETAVGISSLMDSWILLRDVESNGERNRAMYVLKSRGMAHSNQVREFLLTSHGIELRKVYSGPGGVLTGAARLAQEARDAAAAKLLAQEIEKKQLALERRRRALRAEMAALQAAFEADESEMVRALEADRFREQMMELDRAAIEKTRTTKPEEAEAKKGAAKRK